MAGKYGSASVTVSLDDAPGGGLQVITGHVLEMSGVKIESAMELSHAFGDSWQESTPSGMASMPDITLSGFWDTNGATSPHTVFIAPDDGPQDAVRSLEIVFGDSKKMSVDVRLVSYEVLATVGNLTKFTAVIRPTGAGVWS